MRVPAGSSPATSTFAGSRSSRAVPAGACEAGQLISQRGL
jgi:hypothetical protein